ncbi:MAG: carboxyl-terminal processing protease, partial [Planctomycetota bacterium]
YKLKHKTILGAKEFRLTSSDYSDFKSWVRTKEFDYKTESEQLLEELEEVSKEDTYFDAIEETLATLKKEISHDKSKDLDTFNEEIKMLLESEIAKRYYYKDGSIESFFHYDKELKEAISVLKDTEKYKKILQ